MLEVVGYVVSSKWFTTAQRSMIQVNSSLSVGFEKKQKVPKLENKPQKYIMR